MSVFPKEVCINETNTIVDCIGWDPEKGYRMRGDDKKNFYMQASEFTLLSESTEPLLHAEEDGTFTPEREEAMLAAVEHAQPRPSSRPRSSASRSSGPRAAVDPEAKRKAAERLNATFEGVKGREAIAGVAGPILDEAPAILLEKYEHLDNGRFSMTIRNRVRSLYTKEESK